MAEKEENPAERVSPYWMYATVGLVALAVVQFAWWNNKAPEVLKLGEGEGGGYT